MKTDQELIQEIRSNPFEMLIERYKNDIDLICQKSGLTNKVGHGCAFNTARCMLRQIFPTLEIVPDCDIKKVTLFLLKTQIEQEVKRLYSKRGGQYAKHTQNAAALS